MKPFWRTALDYEEAHTDTLSDRLRRCPVIRFEQSDEARPLRNRIHVDSGHPGPIKDSVESLLAESGRDKVTCEWYCTLADPEGNETPAPPHGRLRHPGLPVDRS